MDDLETIWRRGRSDTGATFEACHEAKPNLAELERQLELSLLREGLDQPSSDEADSLYRCQACLVTSNLSVEGRLRCDDARLRCREAGTDPPEVRPNLADLERDTPPDLVGLQTAPLRAEPGLRAERPRRAPVEEGDPEA